MLSHQQRIGIDGSRASSCHPRDWNVQDAEPVDASGMARPRLGGFEKSDLRRFRANGEQPPGQHARRPHPVMPIRKATERARSRGSRARPPAPELVHVKKDDPNHAMKFDYSLRAPNQWSGVTVEIHGSPMPTANRGGRCQRIKTLSMQVYATGIEILRLETISEAKGKDWGRCIPQMTFKIRPGFNTYQVPLKGFTQPAWANVRVDPKDVFRELTSINLTAFCDQCEANKQGIVIVDNVVFEK